MRWVRFYVSSSGKGIYISIWFAISVFLVSSWAVSGVASFDHIDIQDK